MKRNFVEPQMKVMAVNMKENIAQSHSHVEVNGTTYCYSSNGTNIIDTSATAKLTGKGYSLQNKGPMPDVTGCVLRSH